MEIEYEIHILYGPGDEEYYAGASTLKELAPYIRQCHNVNYALYKVTREKLDNQAN